MTPSDTTGQTDTPVLDIEAIEKILPHRYPFLLVDRVLEVEIRQSIRAIKNVTANEPFFAGHFPGHRVMPGVLILETMAQAAAIMELAGPEHEGWIVYLMGIDKAKFRRPVVPGDTLEIEATLIKMRPPFGLVEARVSVEGKVVAEAQIKFALQEPIAD